ncbi:M48 family metalloprotease, partial [Singulisphaera rosea]
ANPADTIPKGLPRPAPGPDAPKGPDPAFVWADTLDLAKLSVEQERRLGQELHRMVLTYNRKWENGAMEQRVEDVARPLLKKRSRNEIDYSFTLLDSEAVNAFSFPGGYVYLCRGLFNLLGEDEDYALEFVLGHEIAHVDLRHAIQRVATSNAEEKKRGLGTLPQFYLLVSFGYPDKLEYGADAWVFRHMMRDLDRSRHDSLAFLRKFERYAQDNGFASGRQLSPPKADIPGEPTPSLVDNHFRAHTAARKRLAELKDFAATLQLPQK